MSCDIMNHSFDEKEVTIEVSDICKDFRVYQDKSHTFKDRILFQKRNAYELNHVLDHVRFQVHKGEALGLIGHNGCGKSTTLKILNKILYPDSGSIRMKGRVSSLIELGAGFHPDMTGIENIYINASIFGLKKKEIDERLNDIIRFSELENFIHNPVRTYSSGMYMRLAFSIAINVDADILLVDEILAVGDANFQKKCFDKLEEIKNSGTTIVIVSHSMDQIQSICDNVIWLDGGRIREMGKARKVCRDYLDAMDQKAEERRMEELRETNQEAMDPMIQYPPSKVSMQADSLARREGTMQARYTEVTLLDQKGHPCRTFGQKPSIMLDLHLTGEPGTKIDAVVNIYNRYGAHCFGVRSYWQTETYLDPVKDGHLVLTFSDLPLIYGEYLIDIALYDDQGRILDNLLHFLQFQVSGDDSGRHLLEGEQVQEEHSVIRDVYKERENYGILDPEVQWKIDVQQ